MRGRGGVVLALATIVAAALASTAGAGSSGVARTQAVNCNGTLKIGIITPLTGGAGATSSTRAAAPPQRDLWSPAVPNAAAAGMQRV